MPVEKMLQEPFDNFRNAAENLAGLYRRPGTGFTGGRTTGQRDLTFATIFFTCKSHMLISRPSPTVQSTLNDNAAGKARLTSLNIEYSRASFVRINVSNELYVFFRFPR